MYPPWDYAFLRLANAASLFLTIIHYSMLPRFGNCNSICSAFKFLIFLLACIRSLRQRQLDLFIVRSVGRTFSGRLVGKIIVIILSFRVGTSKNKNIDYQLKETCVIMSTQVTYETDLNSLLCDSTMSSAPNFCFFMYFTVI